MHQSQKILIIENNEALRELLTDIFNNEGYLVFSCENGESGLSIISQHDIKLVMLDINMPMMSGWDFLTILNQEKPHIHSIIITNQNIDEYMDKVHEFNIGNIITKSIPFNTSEVTLMVRQLVNQDFFGLEKHMSNGCSIEKVKVSSPIEVDELSHALALVYGNDKNSRKLRTVLLELLTNALFYGAKNEKGDDKENWDRAFKLPCSESIEICHGSDESKIGFSIVDHGGKLTKKTILYWLNRQTTKNADGLPLGLFDTHGRGLFITRKFVDRLIVNVEKNNRCECVILNYHKEPPGDFKSLSINEI